MCAALSGAGGVAAAGPKGHAAPGECERDHATEERACSRRLWVCFRMLRARSRRLLGLFPDAQSLYPVTLRFVSRMLRAWTR